MVDLQNPDRYIDLQKWFSTGRRSDVYTDFEGFAQIEGILEKAEKVAGIIAGNDGNIDSVEAKPILKTMLVHFLYESRDQADDEVSEDRLMDIAAGIYMVLSCRYFLREDAK